MSRVEYNQGVRIASHYGKGVILIEVFDVCAVNNFTSSLHSLILPGAVNSCLNLWDGKIIPMIEWTPDDVCFVPAHTLHSRAMEKPYNEKMILIDNAFFTRAAEDHIDYSRIDFRCWKISAMNVTLLAKSMAHIMLFGKSNICPLMVESNAFALAVAVIIALSPSASVAYEQKPYGLGKVRANRITEFIEANLNRQISLSEISGIAGMSQFHMSRLFKNRFGITMIEYISGKRVGAAKIRLRASSDTLAQISFDCGFSSQSHFTTVFRKMTGMTPGAYRSDNRKSATHTDYTGFISA